MSDYDRTLPTNATVRIARQNDEVDLSALSNIIRMRNFMECFQIGDEVHLVDLLGGPESAHMRMRNCKCGADWHSDYYDGSDNTHRVWKTNLDDYSWIHEGAFEVVPPVTQEDEDAAIASILRAGQPPTVADCDNHRSGAGATYEHTKTPQCVTKEGRRE